MYAAAHNYVLRLATDADEDTLARLAELDSKPPLEGSILIGERHGDPVAALSLTDDRVVANPFRPTAHLLATMRVRARGRKGGAGMTSLGASPIAGRPLMSRGRLADRS